MAFIGQRDGTTLSSWLPRRFAPAIEPAAPRSPFSKGLLDAAVRLVERTLRRRHNVVEYTTDRDCVLRIATTVAADRIDLADGTQIRPGDAVVELHFWNEQLPAIPREGPLIAWGIAMCERAQRSLELLAAHLADDAYGDVKALRGEASFGSRLGRRQMARVARRFGFELLQGAPPLSRRFRFFWENFLVWGLIRTFNPGGLRGKRLLNERYELWMSRAELIRRYGDPRRLR
jgi:hypothetical protein